jgi:hypothetical protein
VVTAEGQLRIGFASADDDSYGSGRRIGLPAAASRQDGGRQLAQYGFIGRNQYAIESQVRRLQSGRPGQVFYRDRLHRQPSMRIKKTAGCDGSSARYSGGRNKATGRWLLVQQVIRRCGRWLW